MNLQNNFVNLLCLPIWGKYKESLQMIIFLFLMFKRIFIIILKNFKKNVSINSGKTF